MAGNSSIEWRYSLPMGTAVVTALSLIPLATIVGNGLVIWAVSTQRALQLVQNRLLISLAIADILVAVAVMPFSIFSEISESWIFGFVLCDVWRTLDVMCCTASILHLCAIALDRYWAITAPFTYSGKRTLSLMNVLIGTVWALSLIISLPPVTVWHGEGHGSDNQGCQLIHDLLYILYSANGSFFVPLSFMLVLYCRIYREAAKRLKARKQRRSQSLGTSQNIPTAAFEDRTNTHLHPNDESAAAVALSTAHVSGDSLKVEMDEARPETCNSNFLAPPKKAKTDILQKLKLHKTTSGISLTVERKAANTLGIILGCFILSWLPFFLLYVFAPFSETISGLPRLVFSAAVWLGYVNSMCNPVIYTVFNPDFRKAFNKLLQFFKRENKIVL